MSDNKENDNYQKATPDINPLTKPFWDYCKKHELRMQFCTKCDSWIWYPKAWCTECGSRDSLAWKQLSGRGQVYSFTVIRQVIDNSAAFSSDLPFVVGLIELEEGPRIYSNVTGIDPLKLGIGDKVALYFDDVTPEISLPKFKAT